MVFVYSMVMMAATYHFMSLMQLKVKFEMKTKMKTKANKKARLRNIGKNNSEKIKKQNKYKNSKGLKYPKATFFHFILISIQFHSLTSSPHFFVKNEILCPWSMATNINSGTNLFSYSFLEMLP